MRALSLSATRACLIAGLLVLQVLQIHAQSNEYLAEPTWTRFQVLRYFQNSRDAFIKVSPDLRNGPKVPPHAQFGCSVASLGDLDGNGMPDLLVGASGESYYSAYNDTISFGAGAVYILFMNPNFTVSNHVRIGGDRDMVNSPTLKPPLSLLPNDNFGFSVANIGDLDGDGVVDIAVGAPGSYLGCLYVFYLNRNGTYKGSPMMIREGHRGGPPQGFQGRLGSTVAPMGDLDQDGIPDMIVTAGDASAGNSMVHVLFMHRNASVKKFSTVGFGIGGGPDAEDTFTNFGSSLLLMPDLDGDTVPDLAIGARFNQDPRGQKNAGGLYICFMHRDGTIKNYVKHSDAMPVTIPKGSEGIYLPLQAGDSCGASIAYLGDLNMDDRSQYFYDKPSGLPSIPDLLVGCPATRSGFNGGRAMVTFLEGNAVGATGQISGVWEINSFIPEDPVAAESLIAELPPLRPGDQFGQAVLSYVDFDMNGYSDFLISAPGDDCSYGNNTGAIYLITYRRTEYVPVPEDNTLFLVSVILFPALCCIITCSLCITAYLSLQHREDQAEVIAKEVGIVKLGESVRSRRGSKREDPPPPKAPVTFKIVPTVLTAIRDEGDAALDETDEMGFDDGNYGEEEVELGRSRTVGVHENGVHQKPSSDTDDIEKKLAASTEAFRNRSKAVSSDPRLKRPSVKLSHTPTSGTGSQQIHDFDGLADSIDAASTGTSSGPSNIADSLGTGLDSKRKSPYFTRGAKVEKKEAVGFAKQFLGKNRKLLKPKEITDFAPDDHVDYYF